MSTDSRTEQSNAALLESAGKGFDYLFSNDIVAARKHLEGKDDPFHLLGLGVCAFLEAALGMEPALMAEASRCLSLSESSTRKTKSSKTRSTHRFNQGLEWEILNADAVVLLGLTQALSESYMGYLQCMYSLNTAHSKFSKLYKSVFPNGLDGSLTPASSPLGSRVPSYSSLTTSASSYTSSSSASSVASASSNLTLPRSALPSPKSSLFSRWLSPSSGPSTPVSSLPKIEHAIDGPIEELILAGTAFGYGLFNLVFSLLPKKVQSLVGFLGFKHDRKLALKALSYAATKNDVHSVFAGLVLMTYHGVVLLLSGFQANEARIVEEYQSIVQRVGSRYPAGALWILNKAKILRMSHDAEGAINVLRDGLKPERPHSFPQADMLLIFELAWTLLSQRRYAESAEMFMKMTELNSWSHATYYFLAAGCHCSLGDYDRAQALFDAIPDMIDKKKVGGKDLPTEVLIKKKLAFYKEKQIRKGGSENRIVESIKISPAEELAIFWNTHSRIDKSIAEAHIKDLVKLSPPLTIASPLITVSSELEIFVSGSVPTTTLTTSTLTITPSLSSTYDLDTEDELALRSLLLGINHRTAGAFLASRSYLVDAHARHSAVRVSTWIAGVAMFELAVLDLKEVEAAEKDSALSSSPSGDVKDLKPLWKQALTSASSKLEVALSLATNSTDLSSRLDSRIAMLKDEIAMKKDILDIVI